MNQLMGSLELASSWQPNNQHPIIGKFQNIKFILQIRHSHFYIGFQKTSIKKIIKP